MVAIAGFEAKILAALSDAAETDEPAPDAGISEPAPAEMTVHGRSEPS